MSAEEHTPHEDPYFEQLESLYGEPLVRRVFQIIRGWNEVLRETPVTREETLGIVRSIDREWAAFLEQSSVVSGYVTFPKTDQSGDRETNYYEHETMLFGGVDAQIVDDSIENDGSAHYQLRVAFKREALLDDSTLAHLPGNASVDEIIEPTFVGNMTFERAQRLLEHYCPELLEEIDEILTTEREDESSVIEDLKHLSFNMSQRVEEEVRLITHALDAYCREMYAFDTKIPYILVADGFMWKKRDSDSRFTESHVTIDAVARINYIEWRLYSKELEMGVLVPCVNVSFLLPNINEEMPAIIPVSSVSSAASMRIVYYEK